MSGRLLARMSAPEDARMSTDPLVLLDISAVAARLATSEKQVRNMVARSEFLAPVKVPGLGLRWSARAVDLWIAEALAAESKPRAPSRRPGPAARRAAI
jgi:predicted DNA-binding transcriptional regulator AlpA